MPTITSISPASAAPSSIEAEQNILGAILLGRPTVDVEAAGGVDIFYDPLHGAIYSICLGIETAGNLVSPITVKANLSPELIESLSELGGVGYLARLAGCALAPSEVRYYAQLVAETSAKRKLIETIRLAETALHDGQHTASDVAAQMEAGFEAISGGESRVQAVPMARAVEQAMEHANAAFRGEEQPLVKSGIPAVQNIVNGFEAGELWLLGGRPSMGKSSVGLTIALNAARAGHSVVIASLEMSPKSMAFRAISEATVDNGNAVNYTKLRMGDFPEYYVEGIKQSAQSIGDLPITFLPPEFQELGFLQVGIKQTLRKMNTDKPPLVIIDYLQLIKAKAGSRNEQVTEISAALKLLAMKLELPVVALSQLSRGLEQRHDKRPMMSDLRDSGTLEQDADGVIFCYRDDYYMAREEPDPADIEKWETWNTSMERCRNRLELIVAKQRNGAIGTAKVRFNPALNLIWED